MITPHSSNLAYDFDLFDSESRPVRKQEKKPEVKLIKKSIAKSGNMFKILTMCAAAVLIAYGILMTKADLSEISASINSESKQLEQVMQENVRLQTLLDNMVSLPKVEEYARETLGLAKITSAQEKHISLGTEDMTEIAADGDLTWYEVLSNRFAEIKEYLGF